MDNFTYGRYLAAKKSIDDRALNHHVWQTLGRSLGQIRKGEPMKVLEIGAGIGTMLVRAVERGLLAGPSTYVATDCDAERFRAARTYISQWARQQGHSLSWSGALAGRLRTDDADVSVVFDPISAETLADQPDKHTFCHLLIAHAVLDLIDFPSLLPKLLPKLKDGKISALRTKEIRNSREWKQAGRWLSFWWFLIRLMNTLEK